MEESLGVIIHKEGSGDLVLSPPARIGHDRVIAVGFFFFFVAHPAPLPSGSSCQSQTLVHTNRTGQKLEQSGQSMYIELKFMVGRREVVRNRAVPVAQ